MLKKTLREVEYTWYDGNMRLEYFMTNKLNYDMNIYKLDLWR